MNSSPDRPLRVAVTYKVIPHWRVPVFERLHARDDVELSVFHGSDIPGTKRVNAKGSLSFPSVSLFTVKRHGADWGFHPMIGFSLWKYRPDVILAEGGSNVTTNLIVFAYAKLSRTPVVWWTLGDIPGRNRKRNWLRKAWRGFILVQERSSDVFLGYSSMALAYFRAMGYPKKKCFRAVNCVDTDKVFRDIAERESHVAELRSQKSLHDRLVVLFVGALIPAKRIDRLLRAFATVRQSNSDARLIIVGDGVDRDRMESLARELELGDSTQFVGRVVEGVSDYFELADVFVLPGLGGLAISESLAHGVPVICTRGDGCEIDLVRSGKTGYRTIQTDDAEVEAFLADRILRVLEDDTLRSELAKNSRELIVNEHNIQAYVDNIVLALRHAVSQTNR